MTDNTPAAQLPRYKCHKEVWALKIKTAHLQGDGRVLIVPEDRTYAPFLTDDLWWAKAHGTPDDKGYYIVYQDGYTSWSPTKAFEEGYTRVP